MDVLKKLLGAFDGWKTVIAWVLVQIPFFSANPLLLEAAQKVLADPKNISAWAELAIQALMLIGVADITRKNLVYGVARAGAVKTES